MHTATHHPALHSAKNRYFSALRRVQRVRCAGADDAALLLTAWSRAAMTPAVAARATIEVANIRAARRVTLTDDSALAAPAPPGGGWQSTVDYKALGPGEVSANRNVQFEGERHAQPASVW